MPLVADGKEATASVLPVNCRDADTKGIDTSKIPARVLTPTESKAKDALTPLIAEACARYAPTDPRCTCIVHAAFLADSGYATSGVGKKTNNPGNMRPPVTWKPEAPMSSYRPGNNNGVFAKFETLRGGTFANVDLYARFYSGKTADYVVRVWAGNPQSCSYWQAVRACYN